MLVVLLFNTIISQASQRAKLLNSKRPKTVDQGDGCMMYAMGYMHYVRMVWGMCQDHPYFICVMFHSQKALAQLQESSTGYKYYL